jgi:signal peptidase I
VCAGPEVGDLVKRVVGLPGQTISSRGNTILINGHPQAEPYLPPGTLLGRPIQPPVHIAANHYFVLGDNRADSCDSRYWGTITGSSIVGRVVAIIWRHGHPDLHIF